MKRTIFLALLGTAMALPAQAYDWPWQSQENAPLGFCKGFVAAGLANDQMASNSRTDLWLTWNYINRSQAPDGSISETDFQRGEERFTALMSAGDLDGIQGVTESECYLGRNRHAADKEVAEA